jgi:hypothetical protein
VPVAVEYVSVLVGVKVLVYVLVLLGVCVVVVPVCEYVLLGVKVSVRV